MNGRVLLATWGVLFLLGSPVEARKWSDVAGNQISAEYVRIHEGEVILRQGNRILKCPYDQFSELDKAYIREQMEAERTKESRRTGLQQIGGPVASETSDDGTGELRTWQDLQGNKILAEYAGFSGGRVELLKDGNRVSYRYDAFSPKDQAYVAQILTAEGRIAEIPQMKRVGEGESSVGASGGGTNYGEESDPMANSPGPSYSGPDPPGGASSDSGGGNGTEYEIENASGPSGLPPSSGFMPPQPPAEPPMSAPIPSGPIFATRTVWSCSQCNRELPETIKAGDNCPHCGVYLRWKDGENGKKNDAGLFAWNNRRLVVKLSILGFFLLMGAMGALFRR